MVPPSNPWLQWRLHPIDASINNVNITNFCTERWMLKHPCRLLDYIALKVRVERDSNNEAADEAPLVMPKQLVALQTSQFINQVLNPHHAHLARF
uniref:Uncharacterized protein n=1 Tax=Physcomitrium patens TaxID=3218 RepID=A0A2K1JPI5_PHYPA|nr:hypothetical protein PHYPA_015834 [Physcomitrium patens]